MAWWKRRYNKRHLAKYSQPGIEAGEVSWEEFQRIRDAYQAAPEPAPGTFKAWFEKDEAHHARSGASLTLYHATLSQGFTYWDSTMVGVASKRPTSGLGFFMTADRGAAARHGSNVLEFYSRINNPYYLRDADLAGIDMVNDTSKLRASLSIKGYDSAMVTASGASPYVKAHADIPHADRARHHLHYEDYIVNEVFPLMWQKNAHPCTFGKDAPIVPAVTPDGRTLCVSHGPGRLFHQADQPAIDQGATDGMLKRRTGRRSVPGPRVWHR